MQSDVLDCFFRNDHVHKQEIMSLLGRDQCIEVNGLDKNNDIVFASQITTNLFLLFKNKLKDDDKELLLTNIKRVLDLFK